MSTYNLTVQTEDSDKRIDVYLTEQLTDLPSRTFIKKLIDGGHVTINAAKIKAKHKVAEGEQVIVDIPAGFLKVEHIAPEEIDLDIFYEDPYLVIINKPAGMIVHPAVGRHTGTLVNALMHYSQRLSDVNSEIRPGIVHRLDQETSGLLVVAKDNITHTRLAKQFQRKEVHKKYIALVEGDINFDEGIIDEPIGRNPKYREKKAVVYNDDSKESITRYKVIKRHKGVTLVALYPKTGRTHQLRVHMMFLKHSILGDDKYGKRSSFPRLALHAQMLGFKHPHTKQFVEFISPPPKEFLEAVS